MKLVCRIETVDFQGFDTHHATVSVEENGVARVVHHTKHATFPEAQVGVIVGVARHLGFEGTVALTKE